MKLYIINNICCSFWNTTDQCIVTVLYEWYTLLCILWSNLILLQILQFFGPSPFSHLKINIIKLQKYCSLYYIYISNWCIHIIVNVSVCEFQKGVITSLKTEEGFCLLIWYPICQFQKGKHSLTCKYFAPYTHFLNWYHSVLYLVFIHILLMSYVRSNILQLYTTQPQTVHENGFSKWKSLNSLNISEIFK